MNVGILGSGNVGRTLGGVWAEAGHAVAFGSRDPAKGAAVAAEVGRGTTGGTNDEAAAFGEVLLLTVRDVPSAFLSSVAGLSGKVVIDANNRVVPDGCRFPLPTESFAARLAADVPAARVVKAFNTMAQEVFDHPAADLAGHALACFLAGDDPAAKGAVAALARDAGLIALDCGGLGNAWMLEAAGDLIRTLMIAAGLGPYATFSVDPIPPAGGTRFGGRRSSEYR